MKSAQVPGAERSCPPTLAVYNTRLLSLSVSQRGQRRRQLENVQQLHNQNDTGSILETHINGVTAETLFGSGIVGTHRPYAHDMTIVD